jgi:uncharacterized protein HemY
MNETWLLVAFTILFLVLAIMPHFAPELLMLWHNFWQWVWERRRVQAETDEITARISRDHHRGALVALRFANRQKVSR